MTSSENDTSIEDGLPASAQSPSTSQKLFIRYFTAILIDLVVLNLFVEYSRYVVVHSFTISLLAAVLLQVLLKLTLAVEHRIAAYFKAMKGGFAKFTQRWNRSFSLPAPSSQSLLPMPRCTGLNRNGSAK